jgi:hypothetical protein
MVPLTPPEITRRPSGLNRATRTADPWASERPPLLWPSAVFQIRIVPSSEAARRRAPSLRNSTQLTRPAWDKGAESASPVVTSQIRAVWSAEPVASRRPE